MTWHGHATVLIESGSTRLLTDPLLRRRLGHLTRRVPEAEPEGLAGLDAVLISHLHRDHLDLPSLRRLSPGLTVVPRGAGHLLETDGEVCELGVGEEVTVGLTTVRAVPAVHDASRGGVDAPALGYVVEDEIYFAGDTDLFAGMDALGPLRLALLPVWGWGPSLGAGHMDPARAAEAVARLRPRTAVPIHWGTYFPFPLGRRGHSRLEDPPREFADKAAELAPDVEVRVLEPGQTLELGAPT